MAAPGRLRSLSAFLNRCDDIIFDVAKFARFPGSQIRRGPAETAPVRSPLGRDTLNSLARMAPAPGFGRSASTKFGMGSVGEGGSVGPAKTRSVSSAYSYRNDLLAVLKIRVSMVRFRPRPPFPSF